MRFKWVLLLMLVLPLFFPQYNFGQSVPGAAAYLGQGVGARPLGMGNAFVAVASDATAGYWNPAGLTNLGLTAHSIGSMYTFASQGRTLSYLGYAQASEDYGSFAVSWINYGISGIEQVDQSGNINGSFSDEENALLFSYANLLDYTLRYGVNVKVLQQSLADSGAWGVAFDVGFFYQPLLTENFWMGANFQNIAGRLSWNTGRVDPLLLNAKLGMAYQFFDDRVLAALDADLTERQTAIAWHAGMEYRVIDSVWVRGGWDDQQWTAGASYDFSIIYELDYAFLYNRYSLGDTHHLSLIVRF